MSAEIGVMDKERVMLLKNIIGMSPKNAHKFIQNTGCVGVITNIDGEEVEVHIEGQGKVLMVVKDGKVESYKIS